MRLDKYLAHAGIGSRKQVKELIRKSYVCVNGCIQKKEDIQIDEKNDEVEVNGQKITYQKYIYYMLNKPQGVISATYDDKEKTVMDCFECYLPKDAFPIGRLDKDTEGLLLISNDGALAHRLLSLKYHVDKQYDVKCLHDVSDEMIARLQKPIVLSDDTYQGARCERISNDEIYMTIQEGKYHQIKRMIHYVGNEVIALKRVRFGSLVLDEALKSGEYRALSEKEIIEIGGER